ncbi:MAG: hypothetical protein JWM02_295 [Frankiales bacterium]|nr:hypothetical protein [Frankiales bacterium]
MFTKIPAVLTTLVLGSGTAVVAFTTARGAEPARATPTPTPTLTQEACAAPGKVVNGTCVVVVKDPPTAAAATATSTATSEASSRPTAEATHQGRGRDHAEDGDHRGGDDGKGGRDHAEDD